MLLSFVFLYFIDKSLKTLFLHYIDLEVERVSSVIVNQAIKKVNGRRKQYFSIKKDNNIIEEISYNTAEINDFSDELVEEIQNEFYQMESGNFDSYSLSLQQKLKEKYPFFRNGYLCEVTINSLRGSAAFGNLGPTIPIKLSFMGYATPKVDIQVKEYGVNNVIVEVDTYITVSNLITMPISSKVHQTEVKSVLSFEIIQGKVPDYYMGVR